MMMMGDGLMMIVVVARGGSDSGDNVRCNTVRGVPGLFCMLRHFSSYMEQLLMLVEHPITISARYQGY